MCWESRELLAQTLVLTLPSLGVKLCRALAFKRTIGGAIGARRWRINMPWSTQSEPGSLRNTWGEKVEAREVCTLILKQRQQELPSKKIWATFENVCCLQFYSSACLKHSLKSNTLIWSINLLLFSSLMLAPGAFPNLFLALPSSSFKEMEHIHPPHYSSSLCHPRCILETIRSSRDARLAFPVTATAMFYVEKRVGEWVKNKKCEPGILLQHLLWPPSLPAPSRMLCSYPPNGISLEAKVLKRTGKGSSRFKRLHFSFFAAFL